MRVLVTGGAGYVARATHPWRFRLSPGAMRRLTRVNDLVGGRLSPLPDRGSV